MSVIILNDDQNESVLDRITENFDLVNEFNDNVNSIQLTNVYQLRVDKVQSLLNHLKLSIEARIKDSGKSNKEVPDFNEAHSIKDNLGRFSDQLIIKSVFINPGTLIPMSDILQETCGIVSRLESDKSNLELEIIKQKNKVSNLLNKIQSLSFIRMENLASAVQSEHEACSNDISELQWHIKHRSTIERKILEKRNKAAEINSQLTEDIAEINESIPLVEEKLTLENDMLTKIEEIKVELLHESGLSEERMQMTMSKHADSNKKAEAEREHKKRELHKCTKTLTNTQNSLQHAIKEHKKMEDFKERFEDKILKNHQQIAKLNVDNEAKLSEKNIIEELVDGQERSMKEVSFDNSRLTRIHDTAKNDLLIQEEEQRLVIKGTASRRDDLNQEMISLRRSNNQMEIEIDAIKESREKCLVDTDRIRDKVVSTKSDIEEAERTYEANIEEFMAEAKKHALVKQRLTEKMKEVQEVEDKLRQSLAELENQIKQEIMTKASVKSKMTTDAIDLESSKKESLEKQKQLNKVLKETLVVLKEMKGKVSEITAQHEQSNNELQRLRGENDQILTQRESMCSEKFSRIQELTPTHEKLKARIDVLVQKEEHNEWQIRTMNSQLLEMSASEVLITNGKKKMQDTLLVAERQNNDLCLELEMNRKAQDRVTTALSQIGSQSQRMRNTHTNYLQQRRNDLATAQRELDQSLSTNAALATQYRSLQTDYYGMLDSYLDVIQDHLRGEESVKDIKEIQRLQKHMRNCTEAFFTMKLLYDDDQLRDLRRECGLNVQEIERLKSQYADRIERMKTFLAETFPRESQFNE